MRFARLHKGNLVGPEGSGAQRLFSTNFQDFWQDLESRTPILGTYTTKAYLIGTPFQILPAVCVSTSGEFVCRLELGLEVPGGLVWGSGFKVERESLNCKRYELL